MTSRLGTWSYEGWGGAVGFMSGLFTERATQLGLHLRGESVIDSFTIDQYDAAGRHRIRDITVYASLTVNYGQPTSVNMIGLGVDPQRIAGSGAAGGTRDIPRYIMLEYDGGSRQVDLWGDMFQYARYPLSTPITDTNFLRIVFPDGGVAGDWYIFQDANYGITEFQAFYVSTAVIPEPMTMLAVGLGIAGLGGYVRKRRRA